jgi:hypothetical protein
MVLLVKDKFLHQLIFWEGLCLVKNGLVHAPHYVIMDTESQSSRLQVESKKIIVLFDLRGGFVYVVILWILT